MNIDLPLRIAARPSALPSRLRQSAQSSLADCAGAHCGGVAVCRKVRPAKSTIGEDQMPAYVLGDIRVTDAATFGTYVHPAGATIAQYGGKVLAAAAKVELLDGSDAPERVVVIEFPDVAAARRWYQSPEYQAALPIRLRSSQGRVFLVEGM
jgi:uncharacterized protein (DUF1330 family)